MSPSSGYKKEIIYGAPEDQYLNCNYHIHKNHLSDPIPSQFSPFYPVTLIFLLSLNLSLPTRSSVFHSDIPTIITSPISHVKARGSVVG
jgi:hypothetical protein